MAGSQPVIVYLDTQDYSRFGDVLRGKAPSDVEQIFTKLMELRRRGIAKFVYSMPILSELLQYDAEHEEITLAKARAVEELCGDNALLWPARLIEREAAHFAKSIGIEVPNNSMPWVRSGNEWFPRIATELGTFKERLLSGLNSEAAKLGPMNRAFRRRLEVQKRDGRLMDGMRAAAPVIADKYGIPVGSVERAVLPLLKGKATPEEASRLLFGAIARPTAFVNVYFKVHEGDKSLPFWIRGLGENLERSLTDFRAKAAPLLRGKREVKHLQSLLRADAAKIAGAVLRIIDTDEAEQGVTKEVLHTIVSDPAFSKAIPPCQIATEIVLGYLNQTVAVAGQPAKIEHSFAGDLFHSLYIDCVDVWRGDRRFSELLRQRLKSRRDKIQPSLMGVPDHIRSVTALRPKD